MPCYVILYHDWPTPHFDLFLEQGSVLKAWRLTSMPKPGVPVPATANHDHRLHYLTYEGEVSGGRGRVIRVASGTYQGTLGPTWNVVWDHGIATMVQTPTGLEFTILPDPAYHLLE